MEERTYIDDDIKKDMTYNIYHPDNPVNLSGWKIVEYKNSKSGFEGLIYKKDNHIILVYKGTDITSRNDLNNDLQMFLVFQGLYSAFYFTYSIHFTYNNILYAYYYI